MDEIMPTGGIEPPPFPPKDRAEGTSHQLQAPFEDQLRNEMNFVNFGNLQNPTQMLSCNWMNNQPLHLANIVFSSAKIHPL